MPRHHINTYRKALYETEEVQGIKAYLHHNAPALCIVSWNGSWEPGDTVQKLQHLDGDVLSIDQRALTSVTRRIWAESKDLHLHNLDQAELQGDPRLHSSKYFQARAIPTQLCHHQDRRHSES